MLRGETGFLGGMLVLAVFLLPAVVSDIRKHHIPNRVTLTGALVGLLINSLFPVFASPLQEVPGMLGWQESVAGWLLGLALFLPLYLMRTMGAGDVKLLAMVGAFVGPVEILGVALATMLIGGVLAVVVVICQGMLSRFIANLRLAAWTAVARVAAGQMPDGRDLPESVGKLPYGVAIGAGTIAYLYYRFGVLLELSWPGVL